MTLTEACVSAMAGNFISHKNFDDNQSMHAYNGELYYEDGANLTAGNGFNHINNEDWAKENWYIKYPAKLVNMKKLKEMHEQHKNRMLPANTSYEECIILIG